MTSQNDISINLIVPHNKINIFIPIIQKGFFIKTYIGTSIMEFLLQCGLSEEYILNNIKTVFLDCKPVDDLNNTFIKNNSTLSLSGAMPGLVGAVMRIKSPFQSFRNTISYPMKLNESTTATKKEGLVTIKLFNTVLSDNVMLFLTRGIFIVGSTLLSLIKENKSVFKKNIIHYKGNILQNSAAVTLLSRHQNDLIYVKVAVVD